jgi:uncharacterized protein
MGYPCRVTLGSAITARFSCCSQESSCNPTRRRAKETRVCVTPPGFVQVAEDGRTLFIPDRRGNNRIDGLKNLIEDSRIALIFFVPGVNETYRVNGRAQISQDADFKRRFAVNGKEPATVMVVTVEETFQHCAKALVRSDLWKAGSRGRPQGVPTIGDFVAARNPGIDSAAFNVTYNERIPRELY